METIITEIETGPKQEKEQEILSLEKIFENPEIKKLLKLEGQKRKEGESEIFTEEDFKRIESKIRNIILENKNFNLFNLEEKEGLQEFLVTLNKIIKDHPDYFLKNEKILGNKNEMKKMNNIYSEFPRLLLAIYFENKTGIDFRVLIEMLFEGKKISEKQDQIIIETIEMENKKIIITTIEKIEDFIKIIDKISENFKKKKSAIVADVETEKNKKIIIAKERIKQFLSEIVFCEGELKEIFKKELKELNEKEIQKIDEETDY